MAKVSASQGSPCKVWLELEPSVGPMVPAGFSYYVEWLGPNGEPDFLLRTRENAEHVAQGNRVYLEVEIPKDAPVGLYDPAHFEIRYGAGGHREVREESVDEVPLPSIDVGEAGHPEIPWPRVKTAG